MVDASLPVARVAIAGTVGLALADECAGFGVAVLT